MRHRTASGLGLLAILVVVSAGCNYTGTVKKSTADFAPGTGFILDKTVTVDGKTYACPVFVPASYKPGQKFPAIIFLHGVLEKGNDGKNVGKGLGPIIAKQPRTWPFVTIFPQSPGDWQGEDKARLVMAALDMGVREHGVDPDRVILTGLSNGGQGTWLVGAAHRDRFAALVPMGGHKAYEVVPQLTTIPIWCFHNDMDMLVGSGQSKEMCKRINEAGGNAKLTTYGGLHGDMNHNVWDQAYSEPELVPWMLGQRRNGVASAGGGAARVP